MTNKPQPRHIRIFLSSPGDVTDERSIALSVIDNLLYDPAFVEKVTIRVVAWDKPGSGAPMFANMTPQMAITTGLPKPSDCEIVVVIFWSRMGTPLPQEYHKDDGSPYLSGTEWEFDDALKASKQSGRPEILIYRRTENIMLSPSDSDFMKKYEQWQRVENFFAKFADKETGAINTGFNRYEKPEDFRREFENHLKAVVQRIISEPVAGIVDDFKKPENYLKCEAWTGSPFPGLRAFSEKEAPIFFGRGRETDELIKKVADSRFVAIVGVSGSGKSSVAAAGLISRLRNGAVVSEQANSKCWNIVRFTPSTNPFEQLASALLLGIPELKGDPIEFSSRKEKLSSILAQSPNALSETIESLFSSKPIYDELFLFVDQFEELFTLSSTEHRKPFIAMLAQSVQSASLSSMLVGKPAGNRIRVLVTLRADFYHRCVEYLELAELLRNGSFPLATPSQLALHEMIIKPAERANLSFEKGLPEQILLDTGEEPGALALVAYTLDELYHSGKDNKKLSLKEYEALGGVKGAIGRRAEAVFERLSDSAKGTLPKIFQNLVTVDYHGIATRKRASLEKIAHSDAAQELIDAFTEARLLVQSRGENGAIVEVAHEAIFKSWKRLVDWIEETHGDLYLVEQMSRAATVWDEHGRSRDFLWLGERGQELQQVIKRLEPQLTDVELAFAKTEQEHLSNELSDVNVTHARRSEIGSRLHVISDTRSGVGLRSDGFPDVLWMPIARGFTVIKDKQFTIQPFYLSKYPITYIQYQSFLDDPDGYKNDIWWKDLPEKFRKQKIREQLYKFNNHPRDNISWYQAAAFTNWLTAKLPKDAYPKKPLELGVEIDNRWVVRLPTEWEWQFAANGGDADNVFPWGKEWDGRLANTQESGLQRTVAVGLYPSGWSPFGIMDMAGNVREWCLNESMNFEKVSQNSTHPRILRGGSFSSVRDFAKCNARHSDDPDEQPSDDGFRIAFAEIL